MSHKNMEENLDLIEKQLKDMKREYEILRVPCPPSLIWEISGNSELGEAIKVSEERGGKGREIYYYSYCCCYVYCYFLAQP